MVILFDESLVSSDSVKRAAYRFSDRAAFDFERTEGKLRCTLRFTPSIASSRAAAIAHGFRIEVLDQDLRAAIAAETEPLRNAILAYAFLTDGPPSVTATRFKPLETYEATACAGYRLLPCRFTRLRNDDYVLTNQVGEFEVICRSDLEDLVRHRLAPATNLYRNLKAKHILADEDSDISIELLALKQRTKLRRLAGFTALHMFVVTLRCDHSCPYCQVSRQSGDRHAFDMTQETAFRALDHVFRSPSPAIKIEFQGGESLLNFDLICKIVVRAKELNLVEKRDLEFVIATNLSPLNQEILEFCRTHDILLSTSLDGPRELHNHNRPRPERNSHELTVKGIQMAREVLGRDRVGALMTTTEASLGQPREIIDEYVRLGFDGIFLRALSPYGFAVKTRWYAAYGVDRWLDFYKKSLAYVIELNRAGHFFVEQNAATILAKMMTPFDTGYVDLMNPSGIGIAAVVYNYDGDVYASDEARMLAEMGDKTFRLGNVHDTYEDIFLSDTLLDALEVSYSGSTPMCSECAFQPWCGSEPVYHHKTQNDLVGHKPSSGFCQRNMEIFRHLITLMREDDEVRLIFLSWIKI